MPPSVIEENPVMYRSIGLDVRNVNEETRTVTFSASSEYEARRWGYTEILSHEKGHVRMDRLQTIGAILRNHNPNQIVASIVSAELIDGRIEIEAKFTTTDQGNDAFTEVREGALRGISVGYRVYKWEIDEEEDIYRAVDWEPYEASFTPIPVDPTVGVGRSADEQKELFLKSINNHRSNSQTQEAPPMPKEPTQPATVPDTTDDKRSAVVTPPTPEPTAASEPAKREDSRADVQAEAKAIAERAESLGLNASEYIGLSRADATDKMLQAVAERSANAPIGTPNVEVGADMHDKRADHFADKLLETRSTEVFYQLARENGQNYLSRQDLLDQVLMRGKYKYNQRALETTSSLGNVTVLAGDKALLKGHNSYKPWWMSIASIRVVSDFKSVHSAGVSFGSFAAPGEGTALADLTVDDAGNTGSIAMRGGVVQLTEEAIWGDDLGIFFGMLQQLGYMSRLDEDKVVASALESATFSGGSTTVLAFSLANLKTAYTNFMNVTNASGHKLGIPPTRLVLPTALYLDGVEKTTTAQGETAANIFATGDHVLTPVNGINLADANDWYLAADPGLTNGLQLLKHSAYPTARMEEFDAGAVAARKWKIKYPIGGMVNTLKTGAPIGITKLTQA